jgi:hypothetical protein
MCLAVNPDSGQGRTSEFMSYRGPHRNLYISARVAQLAGEALHMADNPELAFADEKEYARVYRDSFRLMQDIVGWELESSNSAIFCESSGIAVL